MKKLTKVKLNSYLYIIAYLNTIAYLNITVYLKFAEYLKIIGHILKRVELNNRDNS